MRLPPYHSNLNAIELVWAKIKDEVADKNITFKLSDMKALAANAIANVDKQYWEKCVDHVESEEVKYWETEGLGNIQPPLIISLSESESESDENL